MKIGIDISQTAYQNTGVANYLSKLIHSLLETDKSNDYVFFFSSLRKKIPKQLREFIVTTGGNRVTIKSYPFPPLFYEFFWNKLHILSIERFIGNTDIFITSDWSEPPVLKTKKATIIYDLIVYKYPHETDQRIVKAQRRKLYWVKKESDLIFCISKSTMQDVIKLLHIDNNKLKVIYPGL